MTPDEQMAVMAATVRAERMATTLSIPFEKAAREIARGAALYEESVAAMVAAHGTRA